MASTTKVMTGLLAVEKGNLDEIITVQKEAVGQEGSSMYLREGERLTLRELVYGLMLASGNDAAVQIALHIGGSVENFAKMMNERAREIGAMNTNFVTPNGLPNDDHYTTAYDLALISFGGHAERDLPGNRGHEVHEPGSGRRFPGPVSAQQEQDPLSI